MNNLKGYKVVNYDKWVSLPEIFSTLKEAKIAKENTNFGKDTVIEYFNSKNNKSKRFFDNKRS